MDNAFQKIAESKIIQLLITLVTYSVYAVVIGVSLAPSIWLLSTAWQAIVAPFQPGAPGFGSWLLYALCAGAAVYLYFITGIIVMGLSIRLLNRGIKPGVYPDASPTMLRWLIFSGIFVIARATILPMIPMTFFSELFFRLVGCKIGKHVFLNSWSLNDAYLIELEDDVVIGGEADLTAHIYEKNKLILERVKVGKGSVVGAHSYISPGVTIGKDCLIGVNTYVRRGKTIPDGATYTSLAGLPVREMARIEKAANGKSSNVKSGNAASGIGR